MFIDVWSDVVCPWCFIGKRRLESALSSFAHLDQIIIRHRAFQLDPNALEIVSTAELLAQKYGADEAGVKSMQANVSAIADRKLATELGANGVPFFVIDMKYGISGTQSVEVFTQTLTVAWAEHLPPS